MKKLTTLSTIAALCAAAFAAQAQSNDYYRHDRPASLTPRIDERLANQDARIRQGEANGELTRWEARRLLRAQREIVAARDMATSDGRVTRGERERLLAMLDRSSRRIARATHNDEYRG